MSYILNKMKNMPIVGGFFKALRTIYNGFYDAMNNFFFIMTGGVCTNGTMVYV